ncbi:MAG: radical SAM protein [Thermoleophilia bacterium]|nr:radical SAM protein [Thermoleophilia bacterium]
MSGSYPRYQGDVYRPPSEADSLILQVMYGCSHNECTFCGMYADKPFRVRPFSEVKEDVENLAPLLKQRVRRVFLADGDALALPARSIMRILDLLYSELPHLDRVGSYANAQSLLRRSDEELLQMREHGLRMLYTGLESGDEETLALTRKGVTVAQQIEACRRVKEAGIGLSVMAILGLGGVERSLDHARATGKALTAIEPDYASMLSLMLVPGAELAEAVAKGEFIVPDAMGTLSELREIIAATEVTHTVFRTTHASNYLAIEGTLPEDKARMLATVDRVLALGDAAPLRPEWLRGF